MTKPIEAAADLRLVRQLLTAGEPLPPSLRLWLARAIDTRLQRPGKSLDQLLGLSSHAGGRLHAASKIPARDAALRDLADNLPPQATARTAAALAARVRNHHLVPDPLIEGMERRFGRLPTTRRRIQSILSAETIGKQKPIDISNVWNTRVLGHEHTTPN